MGRLADGGRRPVDQAIGWTADEAVTRLFAAHYRPLVRLATLLLGDVGAAEEIVAGRVRALHARGGGCDDHRQGTRVPARHGGQPVPVGAAAPPGRRDVPRDAAYARTADAPSAESSALDRLAHDAVIAAIATLPARQREALVLRYYADLSEAEIAAAMGCSRGAVKSHAARGMAALRTRLERWS